MNEQVTSPGRTRSSPATKLAPPRSGVRSTIEPGNQGKEITFELEAAAAKEVLLAGDFTDWEKSPIKMRRGQRGKWQCGVTLACGRYRYKFLVDGQWLEDTKAKANCPNPYGTCDSVLEII